MKNMKKLAAFMSAAAVLATSFASVSARIYNQATFALPFASVGIGNVIPTGTYTSSNASDIKYIFTPSNGPGTEGGGPYAKWSNGAACTGAGSLFLYGWSDNPNYNEHLTIKIGQKTADNKYNISFAIATVTNNAWSHNYQDYVALNEADHDSGARFTSNTVWTVTDIGVGSVNSGYTWKRYQATLTTALTPEIDMAAYNWGRLVIDDIVVKDSAGNIIFSENFEVSDAETIPTLVPTVAPTAAPTLAPTAAPTATPAPVDGTHVLTTKYDGWEMMGNAPGTSTEPTIKVGYHSGLASNALRVLGNDKGIGKYRIPLPRKSTSNTYYISYTALDAGGRNTKAAVSIDVVGNNIYGAGNVGNNSSVTVSGDGDYLYVAFEGWGAAWFDDIVVRDSNSSGRILFTEDFENFETKYSYYTYDTKLQGLSANGRSGEITLSWRNPDRADIAAIKIFEGGVETTESQLEPIDIASGHVNIVHMTDNMSTDEHTYDVRMYTTDNKIYHNEVTGVKGVPFRYITKTASGAPLNGWRISYADGATVKALGKVEFDTDNYAEGTRSLHINPNFIEEGSTSVSAGYSAGARINLDTSVFGIEAGKTYKLSWKQKGHNVPQYLVQLVMDNTAARLGGMTANTGRVTTSWQDREIEFTPATVGSVPMLRFELSGGADDFWIDDVKLVEVGGTDNILENGTFEQMSSYIHDAELSVVDKVGNEYQYASTPSVLTGNIYLMSSVKIENNSEAEPVAVDMYTVLYKDGRLISVEKTTPSAATGVTTTGSSVIQVPSIDDGDYKVVVLVWEQGEVTPLKSPLVLDEASE